MKVEIKVRDNIDALGMFAIINGKRLTHKVYAKYAECNFKNSNRLNNKNKHYINKVFIMGLLTTLKKLKIITEKEFREELQRGN